MNLESLRDCVGAYGGTKQSIAQGLVLCLEPWRFVVLVVVFVAVAVVLSLLLLGGTERGGKTQSLATKS
ncbi:MAG: hypothetical protein AVDCRST_MAG14-1129 [uncultured Rubrobacteraceae bacterium]|uniref:Uncharacterized protein n=1 Tax=uncultured Rubrobacteraceae bacterium TaxID=349277 RepID=A0A6J4QR66_9ACTN|nr:MAG: hypothetical protein AVDCRST_MAG14-1129 [uncultured Rubrobacteraceae bacterium]